MYLTPRGRFDQVNFSRDRFDQGVISQGADLTRILFILGANFKGGGGGGQFGKGRIVYDSLC